MKIIVFSDSHGNLRSVRKVLEYLGEVDMIFHLGDNVRDAVKIEQMVSCPVKYVKGNTDFVEAPIEIIEEFFGKVFFLTHGHTYEIKLNLNKLSYAAQEKNADIVLFGHSHVPYGEEVQGILFLNPGSIGDKRGQPNETYGIIEIDVDGNLHWEIVDVNY